MKGKSYTAGTPEAAEAVWEACYIIDTKGRANPSTRYLVENLITKAGKESFICYNPATGKTRHAKRIFISSNEVEKGAILYSHPHRDLVQVVEIEEVISPAEALITVNHNGFLYLVSLSDLYSDSSERRPAIMPETTPAPVESPITGGDAARDETPTDADRQPENGTQEATTGREESPEPVTPSGGNESRIPSPVTESGAPEGNPATLPSNPREEHPERMQDARKPLESPRTHASTASHTSTHGTTKSPYKAKYKATPTGGGKARASPINGIFPK